MLARLERWQADGVLMDHLVYQTTVTVEGGGAVVLRPPAWLQAYVVNHEEVYQHLVRVIMADIRVRRRDEQENRRPRS